MELMNKSCEKQPVVGVNGVASKQAWSKPVLRSALVTANTLAVGAQCEDGILGPGGLLSTGSVCI